MLDSLMKLKNSRRLKLDFLGVNYSHYANKEKAKDWYNKIKNIIEKSEHSKFNEAMASLEKLYKGMAK